MLSCDQEISREFLALCQSQLALLAQSLGSNWSAVYLTQKSQQTQLTRLIPVAVYPINTVKTVEGFPKIWQNSESTSEIIQQQQSESFIPPENPLLSQANQNNHQLVVPLVYEEAVIGLLVAKRENTDWKSQEIDQVEKIAETIAIATLLQQHQAWSQENFLHREKLRVVEGEKLDDFLHQLRNPLTALRTFAKLLLKRLLPSDPNHKVAEGLYQQTEHIQELIKEFTTNSTLLQPDSLIDATPSPPQLPSKGLNLEAVKLQEVAESAIFTALTMAETKGITLEVEISEDLPFIEANPQALKEVLHNLLDNALKYTPRGGVIKIVTLEGIQFQGLAIHDTGCGIPPEVQSRIFERHYRGTQSDGNIPGTGLGLAIAKELVTQMRGKIELISPNQAIFNSQPHEGGTTFMVWFPLAGQQSS